MVIIEEMYCLPVKREITQPLLKYLKQGFEESVGSYNKVNGYIKNGLKCLRI